MSNLLIAKWPKSLKLAFDSFYITDDRLKAKTAEEVLGLKQKLEKKIFDIYANKAFPLTQEERTEFDRFYYSCQTFTNGGFQCEISEDIFGYITDYVAALKEDDKQATEAEESFKCRMIAQLSLAIDRIKEKKHKMEMKKVLGDIKVVRDTDGFYYTCPFVDCQKEKIKGTATGSRNGSIDIKTQGMISHFGTHL